MKMEGVINTGIQTSVSVKNEDNTIRDLKRFQDFLWQIFKKQ